MITDALDAITSRKWLVEAILAAVVGLAIWWGCHHLIQIGVLRERAAWLAKVTEANLETARQRGLAEAAAIARQKEQDALAQYVIDHPIHGSLASLHKSPCLQSSTAANPGDTGSSTATAGIQQVPEGNSLGEPGIDSLGLLGSLAARGDQLSAQVREWQR